MKRTKKPPQPSPDRRIVVAGCYLLAALIVALALLNWEPPVVRVLHIHRIDLAEPALPQKQTYPPKNQL